MKENGLPGGELVASLEYWQQFVARCISERLDTDRFETFVRLVYAEHPIHPFLIAEFFLKPQPTNSISLDPRIPPYIKILTQLGYVNTPSILKALYKYSSNHAHVEAQSQAQSQSNAEVKSEEEKTGKPPIKRWKSSYWAEEAFFYSLTKSVVEGKAIPDSRTALDVVNIITMWMGLFTAASTALLGRLDTSQDREEMECSRAALVALLLRLTENEVLYKAIQKPYAKDSRKKLSESLANFVPTLQLVPQITEKLEQFRKETLGSHELTDNKKQVAHAAMDEILDSTVGLDNFVVPEIPVSNTRAGLYIYLNAALIGRPLLDDHALFSYINNKYLGDVQSSAIDLILASFDILANAVFRNEGQKDAHLLRSFLINKLPLLLYQLCPPDFSGTSAEFCITEALSHVDTSLFPTASLMFDESRNNNPYTETVREEFCGACVLHGLIQREHVERILGEVSLSYEESLEKYAKDKLVQNCLSDTERIQGLVRELDKMNGNVGAVCQALVEVLRQLCHNKETMSLKAVCSQLAAKPLSLDVLLLFEKLPTILEPLCQLLDNWSYEEDQGEYQPVYEEFGAILLLVLAFAYRYNLRPSDMGITSADSWVAKILGRGHLGRRGEELSDREKGHLDGWIQGLFDTEGGGLGDELMSSCPPQEFYLVVAPLFQNIVVAYAYGYLNDESLKGGIEYLVDTFLLPSLVPAIRFLADYLWLDQKETKSIIKILQLILLPSSISGEASTMLSSVKNLVAKPLEHALRTYQRRDPKNQDIEPLLRALHDSIPLSRRTGGADHNEFEAWTASSNGGLAGAVKATIQGLCHWSMHPAINSMPTSYTHRQILFALKLLGAKRLLHIILDETRQQTETGSANIVIDVAASLICAPDVTHVTPVNIMDVNGNVPPPPIQRQRTLREMLKAEAEDCKKIQKKDPALAETVVRLHRRVEALMVMPETQVMLQTADMSLNLDGDTTAMAVAAANDAMSTDNMALDVNMTGVTSDLGLGSANGGSNLDTSGGDNDMFNFGSQGMETFDTQGMETFDTQDMDDFDWGNMEAM